MSEQFYDNEIAPMLLEISKRCEAMEIPFLAVVEYKSGHRGRTSTIPENAGLEMHMLDFCARAVPNVDAFIIALIRHCRSKQIPMDASIVLNRMGASDGDK